MNSKNISSVQEDFKKIDSNLNLVSEQADSKASEFNKEEHDSKSRLEITKLFLKGYFSLIAAGFIFCLIYNGGVAFLNNDISKDNPIKYLDVSNTVSIIITALSSGMGFVIGYYFKNKE